MHDRGEGGLKKVSFIVSCRFVVQLEGSDPWYNRDGPAKMGAPQLLLPFNRTSERLKGNRG